MHAGVSFLSYEFIRRPAEPLRLKLSPVDAVGNESHRTPPRAVSDPQLSRLNAASPGGADGAAVASTLYVLPQTLAETAPTLSSSPTSMLVFSNGPSPSASPSSSFASIPSLNMGGQAGGSPAKRKFEMDPGLRTKEGYHVIDQADIYAHVFMPLEDDKVP